MRLLLDTHVVLWWLADDPRLPQPWRSLIGRAETEVFVSAVSAWEMSNKAALGKLTIPDDLSGALAEQRFEELPVTVEDGLAAGRLPRHHDDPFDRMLIAQAAARDLLLLSADSTFAAYEVRLA